MSRYIDADRLRKDILGLPNCYNGFSDTYDKALIIDRIDEQPTADVRENVRGEWIQDKHEMAGYGYFDCSVCGADFYEIDGFNFCSNCGADMRGDKK